MTFGALNPEKFHMKILQICQHHLSDVASHFTLENPKKLTFNVLGHRV